MPLESGFEHIDKRVLYAEAVYGDEEKQAVLKSMDNRWLASGPRVRDFEQAIADIFGKKCGIAVNSGSSANLLAIASLGLPPGAEVITPACTFSTTVSSLLINQLVPVFVDSVPGRYTIDETLVEGAINGKTKALMVPQLVGGVTDMPRMRALADKYGLKLIDDSCDTIAPTIGPKTAASYSDLTTTSFYGSHIITALGMGGMIMTDDEQLRDRITCLRDWGRVGDDREAFDNRFNTEVDGIPYDGKFLYGELGYNLKMIEAAAVFGLEQVKKLPGFVETRKRNHQQMDDYFQNYEKWFYLPTLLEGADTNWLSYALTLKDGAPFTRYDFLKHMEERGIQTRVLFSGNITRHPLYQHVNYRTASDLSNADRIMASGLLFGCHQGLTPGDVSYLTDAAEEFIAKYED